ncbi:ABC transporter ATP-binding protein [Lacunimicrobium album]
MAPQYIYQIEDLSRVYDEKVILKEIWLSFYPGAKIGVLGYNGAGKSTLLRILAGEDKGYTGEVKPAKGIKIGHLSQEPRLDPDATVGECIQQGVAESQAILDRYNELNMKLGEDLSPEEMDAVIAEQAVYQDKIDALNLWELDRSVEIAADALRVPPMDWKIATLSGGEKRRVALCKLLLGNPDLLLLDEPTNHLDAESVEWLEQYLHSFPGTVVAVTHDRYFLDNVAGWILELDRGKGIPYEGNYSSWLDQKAKRLAVEEKQESRRQKFLKQELEWVRSSPKARNTKSKSRLARYQELAAQAYDDRDGAANIQIPVTKALGNLVIRVENLTKSFGDKLLMENLSFDIPPGAIVGIIGPNGAGKTTLFRMIMGAEKPDSGKITIGETVDMAYVDQSRDALDPKKSVYEEISGGHDYLEIGKAKMNARTYCARFNFKKGDQQKFVGDLSGGERNRVHLAKVLRSGGNVILLDEPTNDLDVETLQALEEGLANYGGTALITSHDRWFLDRLATHIIAFEGDSQVIYCEGNYQAYESQKKDRLGHDADQPHRIKYKPISR